MWEKDTSYKEQVDKIRSTIHAYFIRDESFITRCVCGGRGGRLYSGGGSKFFLVMYWGGGVVKIKSPSGRGEDHIFHHVFGGGGAGSVPLVFAFTKSQSFWVAKPPISQMILPTISNIQINKKVVK